MSRNPDALQMEMQNADADAKQMQKAECRMQMQIALQNCRIAELQMQLQSRVMNCFALKRLARQKPWAGFTCYAHCRLPLRVCDGL